jgi:hypothetical protein
LQTDLEELKIGFLKKASQLFIDEFSPHLSVKFGVSMIVLNNETAYFFSARRVEIKNRIHNIDFINILLKPKQDLLFDAIEIEAAIPYREIFVVKAEIAAKHTAALSLNANDASLMVSIEGQMWRRKMVKVLQYRGILVLDDLVVASETDPSHAGDGTSICPRVDDFSKRYLALTFDDDVYVWVCL